MFTRERRKAGTDISSDERRPHDSRDRPDRTSRRIPSVAAMVAAIAVMAGMFVVSP